MITHDCQSTEVVGPAAPFLRPPLAADLHVIRATFLQEDVADLDQEFRAVMAEATSAMDLTVVAAFIERSPRVASSVGEPDKHRVRDRAQRLLLGEQAPVTPWSEVTLTLDLQGLAAAPSSLAPCWYTSTNFETNHSWSSGNTVGRWLSALACSGRRYRRRARTAG